MAVIFALRGNSLTPFRSQGDSVSSVIGTNALIAGGINGLIDMDQAAGAIAQHSLNFKGLRNVPTGQQMSVLMSFSLASLTDVNQLWAITGPSGNWNNQARTSGASQLTTTCNQKTTGASLVTATTAWAPTLNQIYDVVWLIDGSLTTAALVTVVDNVTLGTSNFTATRAALATDHLNTMMIIVGAQLAAAQNSTRIKLNEFVIWDSIITPSTVALTTGTGLNGSTRTAYVSCTAFNGDDTNPGIANVRLSTAYNFGGSALTGTAAIPTAANVRSGTATDATTGSCAVPTAANVRSGTATDATTGTCAVPVAADVRLGTAVDNTTGTLSVAGGGSFVFGGG